MKNTSRTTFFYSDPHFGHAAVIKFCDRPYKSVEEMHEKFIRNWNSVVKDKDIVIITGDFSMYIKKEEIKSILNSLHGTKILVMGNHDKYTESEWLNMGFSFVCRSTTMRIGGETVNISHFPYKGPKLKLIMYGFLSKLFPGKFWRPRHFADQLEDDGRFLIHGHTHSKRKVRGKMIHVGVDAWGYTPVPLQKIGNIIALIKLGKYTEEPVKDNSYHE